MNIGATVINLWWIDIGVGKQCGTTKQDTPEYMSAAVTLVSSPVLQSSLAIMNRSRQANLFTIDNICYIEDPWHSYTVYN